MGNIQCTHGLDRQCEGLIAFARVARFAQPFSCRAQRAENLRAIEALTFTVIAEAHRGRLLASRGGQLVRGLGWARLRVASARHPAPVNARSVDRAVRLRSRTKRPNSSAIAP